MSDIRSARSTHRDTQAAADELVAALAGHAPRAIAFFAAPHHDGRVLSHALMRAFPDAAVIGCSTAGELTQHASSTGSVTLVALGDGVVRRAACALARFGDGVDAGIRAATETLSRALDVDLRRADPERYVGVVLVEGLKMKEEAANAALGDVAPLLSFVGGSAGDDGLFVETRVYCNGEVSDDGAALLLLDARVPFTISKTCSFEPKSRALVATRVDVPNRVVHELDGRPVLEVYAELVGRRPGELDADVFMTHPLGLMIDGQPWIRSPQRVLPDGGLKLYCQLLEGAEVHVMQSQDLIAETRAEIAKVRATLGGSLQGGLAFNCILRRLRRTRGP